jgi:hypothetical protein
MPRKYLTFANVISFLALFVALSAGSYAALKLPKNSVGTAQIKAKAVTRAKLGNQAVDGSKLAANAVDGTKVAADAIDGSKVKDGTLSGSDLNVSTLGKVPSAAAADTAGSAAIARVKIVTASGTADDSSGTPLTATCDAGLNVVGGGASVADGNKGFVNDSYPSGANTWTAHFYAYSGQSVGATAYAICAPAAATG